MYRAIRQVHQHNQFPLPPVRPAVQQQRITESKPKTRERSRELQLCRQIDVPENGMLEVPIEGGTTPLLIVRKGGDEFFALQANCPNCAAPLVKGVLGKSHLRCGTHGSAYNLRTGLLEDGVGLNSLWTFKVYLIGQSLFGEVPLQKLNSIRLGPADAPMSRPLSGAGHTTPIVVLGAGIAGLTCVETLRHLGYPGPIVLISREKELPYDRKSLSKRLCDESESRALRSREFFDQLGISLWLGLAVKSIRPEERRVMVEGRDGEAARAVEYSELVLALGATNRRLQGVSEAERLEGVLYLRTLNDAHQLASEVRQQNVAIIGSGFLGLEVASIVAPVARSVSIYGKASAPLRVFGTAVGNEMRKFMESQGVSVRQESVLRSMDGYDRVQQLTFRDGLTAIADTVIVTIGVMPCTSILLGSGIRTNAEGYVLVDERMSTNVPNVFACGDCVNFPMPSLTTGPSAAGGQQRRCSLPHWQIAQHQGRVAAYSILGADFVPRLVPFLWVRLFDRHIAFSGDPTIVPEERVLRGSITGNDFVVYFLKADKVMAVAGCGPANVAVQFIEIFRSGKAVTKAEVLTNQRDDWRHLLD